jgi:hypothetical protein
VCFIFSDHLAYPFLSLVISLNIISPFGQKKSDNLFEKIVNKKEGQLIAPIKKLFKVKFSLLICNKKVTKKLMMLSFSLHFIVFILQTKVCTKKFEHLRKAYLALS